MASAILKALLKIGNSLHVGIYRRSDGKIANKIAGLPILLITTTGRKSGKARTNPVVYIRDGQDYVVSASKGGAVDNPGWYFNLKNNPEATIQIGDDVFKVNARITDGEERTQLYDKLKVASANFVKYEKAVTRIIPVIRLTPINDTANGQP